jgi:predicted  nucleic acid-binding Zn-ribbon protein
MSIARQLFQLQEVDIELEAAEKVVNGITHRLAGSEALASASGRLAVEREHQAELKKQLRSIELDAGAINAKLKRVEDELYSGRVTNSKELSNLQREFEILKADRNKIESRELEIMDRSEQAGKRVSFAEKEFQAREEEWRRQKVQLSSDLEPARAVLAEVTRRRQQLAAGIEPSALNTYQDVKRTRDKAVVPVERGICTGCRIAISVADTHRVRSGQLVRCGSCGRIVYLAQL